MELVLIFLPLAVIGGLVMLYQYITFDEADEMMLDAFGDEKSLTRTLIKSARKLEPPDTTDPHTIEMIESREQGMKQGGFTRSLGVTQETYHHENDRFVATLIVHSYKHGGIGEFELRADFKQDFAPDGFSFSVNEKTEMLALKGRAKVAASKMESQFFKVVDHRMVATLSYDAVQLRGSAVHLYDQCFEQGTIELIAPSRPIQPKSIRVHGQRVLIMGSLASVHHSDWRHDAITNGLILLHESAAECCIKLLHALAYQGFSPLQILKNLSTDQSLPSEMREEAIKQRERIMTPEDRVNWLEDQALAIATLPAVRGRAIADLVTYHMGSPQQRRVIEAAKEPDAQRLRALLLDHGWDEIVRLLSGPDQIEWLNLYYQDHGGANQRLTEYLANTIHPNTLLHDKLATRAKQVLLNRILFTQGDQSVYPVVRRLLSESDDRQLVELLQQLREHNGTKIAAAIVELACDPKQVDEAFEYIALLSAIRTMSMGREDLFRREGVERFLCDSLVNSEERVALMVPPLLMNLGGDYSIKRLLAMIQSQESKIRPNQLGQIVQSIRHRLGRDPAGMAGAMTLANSQGGELSMTADAGSLQIVDE